MIEAGQALLEAHTAEINRIKDDASIPVRASKKNPHNKKTVREKAEAEIKEKLKDLAVKHGCESGKWCVYLDAVAPLRGQMSLAGSSTSTRRG